MALRVRDAEGEIRPMFVVGATLWSLGVIFAAVVLWQPAAGLAPFTLTLLVFPFIPTWYRALRFSSRKRADQRQMDRIFDRIVKMNPVKRGVG